MASRPMPCIFCGANTTILGRGGTWVQTRGAFVRVRKCDDHPDDHSFETLEQPATEEILDRAEVVSGSEERGFSRNGLASDIDYAVGKALSEGQRKALLRRVYRQIVLTHRTGGRKPDLPREVTMRITPADIRSVVTATLAAEASDHTKKDAYRRDHRRAHMLYALARGTDGAALPDARAVLDWLATNYGDTVDPEGRGYRVRRHYHGVRVDRWLPLRNDAAPEPSDIVFLQHIAGPAPRRAPGVPNVGSAQSTVRTPSTPDSGAFETPQRVTMVHQRVSYDRTRLQSSIRHALAGAHDHTRIARYVLQWVLWSIAGQTVVRQADLASQVSQCLRRVSEVAYLRWVIHERDLDVEDVWSEALGLLAWPSPRLVFEPNPAHDPQRSDHVMPMPSRKTVKRMDAWHAEATSGTGDATSSNT